MEEVVLTDPFDYDAEDRLLQAWDSAISSMPDVVWEKVPGVGLAYSGPGGRPRSQSTFEV
jgi:hypothetical protein